MNSVVGTTNLAPRRIIKELTPVVVGGESFYVVTALDGQIMGIDPNGNIYWTKNPPGAYETCDRKDELLYYKYGVVSFGENYLE